MLESIPDSRSAQCAVVTGGQQLRCLAANRLQIAAAGAVIVHWLPHTAGMRQRRSDRHGHRDEDPRKQQHKQQSGGQAMHGQKRRSSRA